MGPGLRLCSPSRIGMIDQRHDNLILDMFIAQIDLPVQTEHVDDHQKEKHGSRDHAHSP